MHLNTIHHVAVQTGDLENSIRWYVDFFGCTLNWELDRFSKLTLSRLPGIRKLVELEGGGARFHVFDRDRVSEPMQSCAQFQHVCFNVDSPQTLKKVREKWLNLFESNTYKFSRREIASDIDTDTEGNQTFYCLDVNGLEYEFSWNAPRKNSVS